MGGNKWGHCWIRIHKHVTHRRNTTHPVCDEAQDRRESAPTPRGPSTGGTPATSTRLDTLNLMCTARCRAGVLGQNMPSVREAPFPNPAPPPNCPSIFLRPPWGLPLPPHQVPPHSLPTRTGWGKGGGGGGALRGNGRQRRPQKRLGRRLEEVTKAVESGYCRLQCH